MDAAKRALILPGLNTTFTEYNINTGLRIAAFLAQCGHESWSFRYMSENLNYTAAELLATFPSDFNAGTAAVYAHQPQKIANLVYANRMGNGNAASGDGWAFCGKGWIQVTGRYYYSLFAIQRKITIQQASALAQTMDGASIISGWFWSKVHNLNALADVGNFSAITKVINPAMAMAADRNQRYTKYKKVLGV